MSALLTVLVAVFATLGIALATLFALLVVLGIRDVWRDR